MSHPAEHRPEPVRYLPGRATVAFAIAGTAICWLLALGGLVGTIRILPDLSWPGTLFPLLLCGFSPSAVWATRRAVTFRRVLLNVPDTLLSQRRIGDLSGIADSDRRPLRSIGTTAGEIAARTDSTLTALITIPNVRIFRAVRPAGTTLPLTSHAVSAGRLLILVECVAWPPGWYQIDADGRIRCDGQYIGQSVSPLITAVRSTRRLLPRSHRVSALVAVYRTGNRRYALPTASGELAWTLAEDMAPRLRERIAHDHLTVSRHTLAALCPSGQEQVVTR
jgi:hypothetical protein